MRSRTFSPAVGDRHDGVGRRYGLVALTILAAFALLLPVAVPAQADPVPVTVHLNCAGVSRALAETIGWISPGSTIVMDSTCYIDRDIVIDKDLTITAAGAGALSKDAGLNYAFNVEPGVHFTLKGVPVDFQTAPTVGGLIFGKAGSVVTVEDSIINKTILNPAMHIEGTATIRNSTFTKHAALDDHSGGAVELVGGSLTISDSVFVDNRSNDIGGAVSATGGTVVITRSHFHNNGAANRGGAIGIRSGATLTLDSSTINNNSSGNVDSNLGSGGGVWAGPGTTLHVINSTIAANVVIGGDSAGGTGGGIAADGATVDIVYSTIAGNMAFGSNDAGVQGGGLYASAGSVTIRNSVLTDNIRQGFVGNCFGAFTSQGATYIRDVTGCTGYIAGPGDVTGVDPKLNTLGPNGGPTPTMLPQSGSPLIDKISTASCGLTIDQRGTSRPQAAGCDVGAVEVAPGLGGLKCTMSGSPDADRLRGTSDRDVICGSGGDDRIWGLNGNDVILGGAGDDHLYGGGGMDDMEGGEGNDVIGGDGGSDDLFGDTGDDSLFGGAGADDHDGGAGSDTCHDTEGANTFRQCRR